MPDQYEIDFSLGIAGVALLRSALSADVELKRALRRELTALLKLGRRSTTTNRSPRELSAGAAYARSAATYDRGINPLALVEQPAVEAILQTLPPGHVLDAGCGTGRYTRILRSLGHHVVAADLSPEMLRQLPGRVGDRVVAQLQALPFPDRSFDLVVCSLVLTHEPDLLGPVSELARVTRRGGTVLIADMHPTTVLVTGQAPFSGSDGEVLLLRNFIHLASDYLAACRSAGLALVDLFEPRWTAEAGAHFDGGLAPRAIVPALVGLPAAIVLRLVRR